MKLVLISFSKKQRDGFVFLCSIQPISDEFKLGIQSTKTFLTKKCDFSYRDLLDEKTPELFSGKYKIITEFGRSLLLKAGKSLTRINYIKNWLPEFVKPICLTHLGTNQFIRAAYLPKTWSHRMSAIDGKTGKLKKSEDQITYDVAGPLCFQVLLTSSIYARGPVRGELKGL